MLGICVLVLICVNVRTVVFPTLKRAIGMEQAYDFMTLVRSLQNTNTVLSEDTFFFRTSYKGELIDMGDNVSRAAKSGYFGEEFNKTVKHHFERTRSQPPDYIVTGFAESPELRTLIQGNYILIAKGPDNLTANGHYASKLFKRKELIAVGSAAYEERR